MGTKVAAGCQVLEVGPVAVDDGQASGGHRGAGVSGHGHGQGGGEAREEGLSDVLHCGGRKEDLGVGVVGDPAAVLFRLHRCWRLGIEKKTQIDGLEESINSS